MVPPAFHYQPYATQHEDPQGAAHARPTALHVIQDEDLVGKLSDKVMLITGCSAGIGIETARALHATGAKLFLTVRNKEKGEVVIQDIIKTSRGKGSIEVLLKDLSNLSSIRSVAVEFLSQSNKLNVLIENAGVMVCAESKTIDGFEMQIGTDHFGHFLFFQLLKPALLQSSTSNFHSRIIVVSSSRHRVSPIRFHDMDFAKEGYQKWTACGIERYYGAKGLNGYVVHPGAIFQTELTRHATEDLAQMGGMAALEKVAKSVQQGAATQVWAAVSAHLEAKGGVYLADVGEAKPVAETEPIGGPGYAPYAYDEEAEEKLWQLSYDAVGLPANSRQRDLA